MPRYLEDIVPGETWTSDEIVLSEEDIIRYAREYDPQPMHTDPAKAAESRFGSLIASGWQVAALSMKLFVEGGTFGDTPLVGLGVDELRWRKPVRPGDRLHCIREIISAERSRSRPQVGTVRTKVTVRNQDGDDVMTMVSLGQVRARSNGDEAS